MQKNFDENNHNQIITKSNAIINSSYSFSLLEQQILLYIVSMVNPFGENFPLHHKVYIKDFLKKFPRKNSPRIYSEIENAIMNRFWEKQIGFWDSIKSGHRKIRWLTEVFYSKGNGYFEVDFNPPVQRFLHNLTSNFTSYYIKNINKFKSIFSIRVYEICVCNINRENKANFVCIVTLKDLREWLELEDKYERDRDFKRRVLQKAKEEINEHSDLIIDFEEIRKGRKVESIKFIVVRKPGTKRASYARQSNQSSAEVLAYQSSKDVISNKEYLPIPSKQILSNQNDGFNGDTIHNFMTLQEDNIVSDTDKHVVAEVIKFGISRENAIKALEEYGASIVMQAVSKVQKSIDNGIDIQNTAGYFIKTLGNSGGEFVYDAEQYKDILEAEKQAKNQKAIELEIKWVEFDKWCSQHKGELVFLIGKIRRQEPLERMDELFLKDAQDKITTYDDISKNNMLLTDIFIEVSGNRQYISFNQLKNLMFKINQRRTHD